MNEIEMVKKEDFVGRYLASVEITKKTDLIKVSFVFRSYGDGSKHTLNLSNSAEESSPVDSSIYMCLNKEVIDVWTDRGVLVLLMANMRHLNITPGKTGVEVA